MTFSPPKLVQSEASPSAAPEDQDALASPLFWPCAGVLAVQMEGRINRLA